MLISFEELDFILDLNSRLRDKTIKWHNEKTDSRLSKYTPWMCYPIRNSGREKLYSNYDFENKLCTDFNFLEELESFFYNEGKHIVEGFHNTLGNDFKLHKQINKQKELVSLYNHSIKILHQSNYLKSLWTNIIDIVVPLNTDYQISGSRDYARGAILISINAINDPLILALELSHELGHNVLMLFNSTDNLVKNLETEIYSGVRKTKRPAIQSLHAIFALTFILILLKELKQKPQILTSIKTKKEVVDFKFSKHLNSLKKSIKEMEDADILTNIGEKLISDCKKMTY